MSPDGTKALFVCDWNLWVKDVATGAERQLTTDGQKNFGYATSNAGWTTSAAPAVSWSPDGRKIATQQQDERKVGDMYLVETPVNGGHPVLRAWKYPLPGDPDVAMISRVVIDVDTGRMKRFLVPPDFHRGMSEDNIDMGEYVWSPDGTRLGFVSTDRFHKNSTAKLADTSTGEVTTLFTETEKTHVQTRVPWQILWGTKEVLWYSQHDGTAQMYLYDLNTGRLENQVTSGVGPVTRVVRIDEATRTMWYEADGKEKGQDPVLHPPVPDRTRREAQRVADARQRHALNRPLARRQIRGRYVLAARRRAGDDAARRHDRRADHAAREGRHLEAPRDRLEAADADQDAGGRRQDGDLRHALPADELRYDQEVPDHQQRVSRAAVGKRGIARVHGGARRPAGAGRTRLRRRHHRRHGYAEPVEGVHRRVLRRDGPAQHDSRSDRRHEGARGAVSVD